MTSRNYSIDKLKLFCSIIIVWFHLYPFRDSNIGWIINTLCRIAVPTFFVISGYLFHKKFNKSYTKKYFFKMIKLLLSWSLFYLVLDLFILSVFNIDNGNNIFMGYIDYLNKFKIIDLYYARGIIKYHLWYLSAMIFTIPIMHIIISNNIINKSLLIAVVLNLYGILICNKGLVQIDTTRDTIFFSLAYCIMGIYINKNEHIIISFIKKYKFIYILIPIFSISLVIERLIYEGNFVRAGDSYISTIPLAFLIFTITLTKESKKKTLISKMGENCLGIYIMHVAIIELVDIVLSQFGILNVKEMYIWQFSYPFFVAVISYICYLWIVNIVRHLNFICERNRAVIKEC